MALYEYLAFSNLGKKIKGIIDAESIDEAKAMLQVKKITILKIAIIEKRFKNLNKVDVLSFFHQLNNLLSAGLPLYESLQILAQKSDKRKVKLIIFDLSEKIKSGYSLAQGMKDHPASFDLIVAEMIENAQQTGRLEETLEEIIKILTNSQKLKKKLVAAFTYPIILSIFCFVVLNFLLFVTIPTLFDLFEDRALHPFTKIVFAASKFAINNKLFVFGGVFLIAFFILGGIFYSPFKKIISQQFIKIPFLKPFLIKVALIRFFISYANLLKGGESYENALDLATNVLDHSILQKEFSLMKDQLIEGKHLSELLKNSEYIPDEISKMLSIAEETSQMPKMLLNIAKIYEEEVDKFLARISTIIQPVLLIILGLIIGFVVLSILIPLTDVSSFIGE